MPPPRGSPVNQAGLYAHAKPPGGPTQIEEFYNESASGPVLTPPLEAPDRMALYRQHLRTLGFEPAPAASAADSSSRSERTVKKGCFSRRERTQEQSQPVADNEQDDVDDDDEFARYQAEVAAAKRGVTLPLPTSRPQQQATADDIRHQDIAQYRDEITAAKARNESLSPFPHRDKSKRGFWGNKKKAHGDEVLQVATTRYA